MRQRQTTFVSGAKVVIGRRIQVRDRRDNNPDTDYRAHHMDHDVILGTNIRGDLQPSPHRAIDIQVVPYFYTGVSVIEAGHPVHTSPAVTRVSVLTPKQLQSARSFV